MSQQDSPSVDDQQVISETPIDEAVTQSRTDVEHAQMARELSHAGKSDQLSMQVQVRSPYRDYYEGLALSLSAENATGPFDILPHHHNFISLLQKCELVVRTAKEGEKRILISGGLIHVKADRVIVFLDI